MGISHAATHAISNLAAAIRNRVTRFRPAVPSKVARVDHETRDRRSLNRRKCDWPARCLFDDGRTEAARIVDVSDGGFGLLVSLSRNPGDRFRIAIDSIGDFRCEIAWTTSDRTGVFLLGDKDDLSTNAQQSLSDALSSMPVT